MILPLLSVTEVANYGTMLQTYALQRVLNDYGYETEIINYNHREFLKQMQRLLDFNLVRTKWKHIQKNQCFKRDEKLIIYEQKKNAAFQKFRQEKFCLSEELKNRNELIRFVSKSSSVVLGSDQVWNPLNLGRDYFTMNFVPYGVKKIAYAPSFGVNSIPKSQHHKTKMYLERIECLSIREESGAKMIYELTGRNAKVVWDPTLLLDYEVWEQMEREVKNLPQNYIFCYFLGDASENRMFANRLRDKTGYQIVHLPFMDEFVESDLRFGDIVPEGIGPMEFLYLIHHAAFVCTDSFHGTVFSLQFSKKFYSMPRTSLEGKTSTSSRIVDLLHAFGIEEHFRERPEHPLHPIDWKSVHGCIKDGRKASLEYLVQSLGVNIC